MSPIAAQTAPIDASEAQLPSQPVRTALSIFLFAHLFTIAMGLIGRTAATSELGASLAMARPFSIYRQLLDMDLPYTFALNRDQPTDVNHVLEATLQFRDGSKRELRFPDPPNSGGLQARHWRALNQTMAINVGAGDLESILPTGIGAALVRHYGAKDVNLRLRAHFLLNRAELQRDDDPDAASHWRDVYEARVWVSGEQPHLMKKEGRGESAPVAEPIKLPNLPNLPTAP